MANEFPMVYYLVAHITAVICCSMVESSACVLPVLNKSSIQLEYDSTEVIVSKHQTQHTKKSINRPNFQVTQTDKNIKIKFGPGPVFFIFLLFKLSIKSKVRKTKHYLFFVSHSSTNNDSFFFFIFGFWILN